MRLAPIPGDVVRHIADDNNPPRLYRVVRMYCAPAFERRWCVDLVATRLTGSFDRGPAAAEFCAVEATSWVDRLLLIMMVVAWADTEARERHHYRSLVNLRLRSVAAAVANLDHATDEDCLPFLSEDGTCAICGVAHGSPCDGCGGRGYHVERCEAAA